MSLSEVTASVPYDKSSSADETHTGQRLSSGHWHMESEYKRAHVWACVPMSVTVHAAGACPPNSVGFPVVPCMTGFRYL